ncbi:MAG: hypothetical protein J6B29_01600 [Clostridia bacterium]|nr:hypothetical protein [Clostridia bacterium]
MKIKKILILSLVLLLTFCLFSCNEDEGDVPDGMKLASNLDIVDYKLFVPESWMVLLNDTRTAVQISKNDATNINVAQWSGVPSLEEWWNDYYKVEVLQDGGMQDVTVLGEGVEMLLDGHKAMKYTYTAKIGKNSYKYDVIACVTRGSVYVMHITYAQDKLTEENGEITYSAYEKNAEAVKSVIDNFKFN